MREQEGIEGGKMVIVERFSEGDEDEDPLFISSFCKTFRFLSLRSYLCFD